MNQTKRSITFMFLMMLASHATAVTSKCMNAQGNVIYTNTDCPSGYQEKSVSENVTVIDGSAERALIARELEKSGTPAASPDNNGDNNGNEPSASDRTMRGLAADSLANIRDTASLIRTTATARENLWLAIAILVGIAILFLFFSRRKQQPSSKIHAEIDEVIEQSEP
ncbi:MAG: hypothetical protein WBQ69_07505 [Gallionella sp.]